MTVSSPESAPSESWRRWLLMPSAARLGAKAPRNPEVGWDQYWSEIKATGDGGDVLWDTSNPGEMEQYLPIALEHLDPGLPIVDVGCGNGRQARILAEHFPDVLGVDLSPQAVERAKTESAGVGNLRFLALDVIAPEAGARLVEAVGGEANVFVRGVFHVLPPKARLAMAVNLRQLLGTAGRLFLAETNYPGDSLGYLQHLGARRGWIPAPLQRAITRLPKPRHFGALDRENCMPADEWVVETDGLTSIYTIPLQHQHGSEVIPGYYAVMRPK